MKSNDWRTPIPRYQPLPGQLDLFDKSQREIASAANPPFVDAHGQRFLADYGHRLPGVNETTQRLIWDV